MSHIRRPLRPVRARVSYDGEAAACSFVGMAYRALARIGLTDSEIRRRLRQVVDVSLDPTPGSSPITLAEMENRPGKGGSHKFPLPGLAATSRSLSVNRVASVKPSFPKAAKLVKGCR